MKQYKIHSTNNTKRSKYKYTYYQNTRTKQNPHIHKPTHPHIIKQVKTTTVQVQTTTVEDTPKWNSHDIIKYSRVCFILCERISSYDHVAAYLPAKFYDMLRANLKKESLRYSELSVTIYQSSRRSISKRHHCGDHKFLQISVSWFSIIYLHLQFLEVTINISNLYFIAQFLIDVTYECV
jgi:hypothetical protein